MIARFLATARNFMVQFPAIAAAGVAIGGPLDLDQGIILGPPNLPGWNNIPLRQRLIQSLNLPVNVEHDASACALAEHRWGAGRKAKYLAYLTCGTGLGVGLVLAGKMYRGAGGLNPEVFNIRLREDGPRSPDGCGNAESFCSAKALSLLASWLRPERWGTQVPTPAEVARLSEAGDPDAQAVVQTSAQAVGDACAVLSDLLRLELILIGRLAGYLGEPWLRQARQRFAARSLDGGAICTIAPAGLGERLQDCSALAAAVPCCHSNL
jgi:glucokinase